MKLFFMILFSLVLILPVWALDLKTGELISIESNETSYHKVEYISEYQDRWFGENEGPTFILILDRDEFFYLVLKNDKIKITREKGREDLYIKLLKKNQAILKRLPIKGRQKILVSNDGDHLYEKMFGNFAWDIVSIDENEQHYLNEGDLQTDHLSFKKSLYAPISGTVTYFQDSNIDNEVDMQMNSSLKDLKPNYLLLHINGPFYLSMVHFLKDSMYDNISFGKKVKVGDYLGKIGNSGVSYLPHLHLTLFVYLEKENRYISVPSYFKSTLLKKIMSITK